MTSKINKWLLGASLVGAFIGCSDNEKSQGPSEDLSSSSGMSSSSVIPETSWCEDKGTVLAAIIDANITENSCISAATASELSGIVYVESGATLYVEAGATIKSVDKSALIIAQGAKIMAEGTSTNPIVFTSGASVPNQVTGVES